MRGLIKPSQPALMETWWWKKILHFCLSPPVLLERCLDSRGGLLMLGGTGGTAGCGDTAVGSLPAPSSQPHAVGSSSCHCSQPLSLQEEGLTWYPHSRADVGFKPSLPHFLSPMMAPGSGLGLSPGLECLNLKHHEGRLSISPGWEQPCQG